jgi:hypothetical protein
MKKDPFLVFYEGKDAGPHDCNPYPHAPPSGTRGGTGTRANGASASL